MTDVPCGRLSGRPRVSAALLLLLLLLQGCVPLSQRSSGRVFPLPRQRSGDGLAVVTRPGGGGIAHLARYRHRNRGDLPAPLESGCGAPDGG